MNRAAFFVLLYASLGGILAAGCSGSDSRMTPAATSPALTEPASQAAPASTTPPAQPAQEAAQPAQPAQASQPAQADLASAPVPAQDPGAGHDFAGEAALIYRIAACGSDAPLPPRAPARAVAGHCRRMHRAMERYRQRWATLAAEFIARLRPADLPARVVYPFGGGDLVSALVVFPEAREITTISLEAAGDPRPINKMSRDELREELKVIGDKYQRLLRAAHSTTKSLQIASHSRLPGTVVFAMAALALHDFEPVSLRYFRIAGDGSLDYLDMGELDTEVRAEKQSRREHRRKRKLYKSRQVWREQVAAFANMEIRFRRRGEPGAPVRVYRHVVANLDDPHQSEDGRLITHLAQKGKVAVMTKAASYLLWLDEFSIIRNYLLEHAVWMISDSSGIPPALAREAGFEQIPYGDFAGPYFYRDPKRISRQMIELWESSPKQALPFRFGYPDMNRQNHMLIMKPRDQ